MGYNCGFMPSSEPMTPEREAIGRALTRIERRLRLNHAVYAASLIAGLAVLALLAWRALRWLGESAPAAAAVVIVLAILGASVLLFLLLRYLVTRETGAARAAGEADTRAALNNELTSAYWFLNAGARSEWIAAHLQHAAHTASGLEAARLIPVRLPLTSGAVLAVAVIALAVLWFAPPLAPASALAPSGLLSAEEVAQVRALGELAEAVPDSEAARRLEAALRTLQDATAPVEAQRRALAQANDAVQQLRLEAASTRERLQRMSDALRGQPGMEQVAEALASGDAETAAQRLAQLQTPARQAQGPGRPAGAGTSEAEPAESAGERGLEQALQEATAATGPTDEAGASELARQEAVDRLKEIARELEASARVNEAWQRVRGPQLTAGRSQGLSASRFAAQTPAPGTPSPGSGETPMEGGAMFRAAAVAEGDGRTEHEGGTRAGDALGDAPADPLLGTRGERLEAQLAKQAIAGEEQDDGEDQNKSWYYAQSQQQKALARLRQVQAAGRFAAAEGEAGEGISIQHRQIVKDYFMNLREGAR
jgi:hypothetical protein